MPDCIRWGILGTGMIARAFAMGLAELRDAELTAVGSRSPERAQEFGGAFGVPHRHIGYEAVAADPDVDVVYVATPHSMHREDCLLCLQAGKPVLCEKPFTLNAVEAAEVMRAARERGLFLMEAMWTRFLPAIVRFRSLLAEGVLGEPQMLAADFGLREAPHPRRRLIDPALGGGALLDLGVYTVSLASMIFGEPARIASLAELGPTGVDEQAGILLGYGRGRLAILFTAIMTRTPTEATLMGTQGFLRIHAPMFKATRLTLARTGRGERVITERMRGNGLNYEAAEVMRCLRSGALESPAMPLDETLSIMRTMDAIRDQWGLRYPGE
jgi:predicted dehydrogenase